MLKRSIAALIAVGLFGLVGVSGATAAETTIPVVKKVALTPEQKAAFEAAKATFKTAQASFKAAHDARESAIAAIKPVIAAAKTARDAAIATAIPSTRYFTKLLIVIRPII